MTDTKRYHIVEELGPTYWLDENSSEAPFIELRDDEFREWEQLYVRVGAWESRLREAHRAQRKKD